jgi:hypothetical protein
MEAFSSACPTAGIISWKEPQPIQATLSAAVRARLSALLSLATSLVTMPLSLSYLSADLR